MSEIPPHQKWRADFRRMLRTARRLERIAIQTELPLEVRPHWPGLDWPVFDETLAAFSARVKRVAARLGPPEKVDASHWLGAYEGRAPDLVARWKIEGDVEVTVRALMPTGCKVDPRTAYAPEQKPELHPECKAVLDELEELDG